MFAAQADQEARRAAEMVLAILGERSDHVEGPVKGLSRCWADHLERKTRGG